MATAMIDGLIEKNVFKPEEIAACAPSESTRQRISDKGVVVFKTAAELCEMTDNIVLAIKPVQIPALFTEERPNMSNHLVMSIVAGVTIKSFLTYVPDMKIVRVMPNHCCKVLEGASGYVMGPETNQLDKELVEKVLGSIGLSVEVTEKDLDAVTGVSGSSPAYIYMFAKGLIKAGMERGLTESAATALAAQSLIGAGHMLLESDMSPDALIDGVCSPGGTTIEGVKVLKENNLEDVVIEAVEASILRSIEMGKNL